MISKILNIILYPIRHQKKSIMIISISSTIFTLLFFPYNDLSDYITQMIAKKSQNQVFVQFDELGIGFFPPSLKMSNVALDTPFFSTLKAGALYLAPSIAGLLAFNPGFTASIDEVMKGKINVSYRGGSKVDNKIPMQKIDLNLSRMDLKELSKFADLPVRLEGQVFTDLNALVDLTFIEQPNGELNIQIKKFHLPASTIPTMLGPASLPSTELSIIVLKCHLKNSDLVIDEGQFGAPGEPLNGRFKGRVGLRLNNMDNRLVAEWGDYQFKIDMQLDHTAEKNFGLYLSFYDRYKTLTGSGSRFALTLSGSNFQSPPTAAPLGTY